MQIPPFDVYRLPTLDQRSELERPAVAVHRPSGSFEDVVRYPAEAEPDLDGASFHLFSGLPVYLGDPARITLSAFDIYHHTLGLSRFTGAPRVTILRHGLHVALLTLAAQRPDLQKVRPVELLDLAHLQELNGDDLLLVRLAAAHDIPEIITGELPAGVKRLVPEFKARVEVPVELVVHNILHLPAPTPEQHRLIKVQDKRAPLAELSAGQAALGAALIRRERERGLGGDMRWRLDLADMIEGLDPLVIWSWYTALIPRLRDPGILRYTD